MGGRNPVIRDAVDRAEQTSPRGQAGLNLTPEQEAEKVAGILVDLDIDAEEDAEKADKIRTQITGHPMTILDGSWPGKELMAIDTSTAKRSCA